MSNDQILKIKATESHFTSLSLRRFLCSDEWIWCVPVSVRAMPSCCTSIVINIVSSTSCIFPFWIRYHSELIDPSVSLSYPPIHLVEPLLSWQQEYHDDESFQIHSRWRRWFILPWLGDNLLHCSGCFHFRSTMFVLLMNLSWHKRVQWWHYHEHAAKHCKKERDRKGIRSSMQIYVTLTLVSIMDSLWLTWAVQLTPLEYWYSSRRRTFRETHLSSIEKTRKIRSSHRWSSLPCRLTSLFWS